MRFLIFVVLSIITFDCKNDKERIQPRKGSITQSVYASLTVIPDSLYSVYAAVGGIIDKIFVTEGDLVLKDQPILQIINNTPYLNVENAKLALTLAQDNYQTILKKITNEVEILSLKYEQDSINYFRQKRLWARGVGTKNQYDERKLAFQISARNLKTVKSDFKKTADELKTQLRQAQNNYKTALIVANDFEVRSNIKGKVYNLLKEPGENVLLQEPLATIGSANSFLIKMLVDEMDIAMIELDQRVLLTLEAYGQEVFEAKVNRIYPKKDERTQTFTVEAVFTKPPSNLYAGLSGEANIIIDQNKNALIVPRNYLFNDSTVITENGELRVQTGLFNLEEIEILLGLDSTVFINKP